MKSANTASKAATYLSWLTAAVLVLLPFHALLTTWAGSNFGHLDLWRIWKDLLLFFILLPGGLWLAWRSNDSRRWLLSSWEVRLAALYVFLFAAMGIWAYAGHRVTASALAYSLITNLRFILFFLICIVLAANSTFLVRNWQKILLAPAAVVLFFGLLQRFVLPIDFLRHFGYGPKTIPAYQNVDATSGFARIQSTMRGANPLGAYLVLIIPALVFIRQIIARYTLLAISLVVLFYSYSRSAMVGLVAAALVVAWVKQGGKLKGHLVAASAAAIVVVAASSIYLLKTSSFVQDVILHTSNKSTSSVTSNEARLQSIKSGALDVWHNPFGSGPGTAGPASFRNNNKPRIAENYFLQIGQEVGVLGMALFAAINVLVGWQLWQRRQNKMALILFASLVGLTCVNILSHAWADDTLSYLWWGLTGIALSPAILISGRHKRNGKNQQAQQETSNPISRIFS
jgi:hypothetical protein